MASTAGFEPWPHLVGVERSRQCAIPCSPPLKSIAPFTDAVLILAQERSVQAMKTKIRYFGKRTQKTYLVLQKIGA